jgi:hypothetical protein
MIEYDEAVPEESEQLDQLQPEETLVDRGVVDVLDEGIVTPEMRRGETFEQRLAQEVPEVVPDETPWNPDPSEPREVGHLRAGRLVDASGGIGGLDDEPESVGRDVGIDGGGASAEEAAMHIIDDYDDDDD